MNDERYILARLKVQLLRMLKDDDGYERSSDTIHKILDLIIAIEVTTVLDMELDEVFRNGQEDTE